MGSNEDKTGATQKSLAEVL